MNAAQVLDHFDRISDAPDAIPRLRRFILDLAVRGKLVEQDPNDEPASALLKRIQTEKARLGEGRRHSVTRSRLPALKNLKFLRYTSQLVMAPPRRRWRLGVRKHTVRRGNSESTMAASVL